ncbi:hypothetical protein [Helicobacter trogontum]|uniref:Lipoprotein n=1 Tax=Helicobacter trogontum TaxID=50960 RepID=A0A4U8S222_9HELI|nr:hypothetical protein [Helicobacter trogontum]TLD79764.1 hypothetical protein LS81_010165 [Helicobacter trogontum]
MNIKLCLLFFVVCFLHACSHNSDLQTTNIAIKNITSLSQKDMEKYIPPSLDYGELDEKASQLALECNGTREAEKRASLFIANPRQIDNILICYDYYHASMLSSSKVILHIRDLTNNKHLSFKNAGFSDISADKELILIAQKGKFFLFSKTLDIIKTFNEKPIFSNTRFSSAHFSQNQKYIVLETDDQVSIYDFNTYKLLYRIKANSNTDFYITPTFVYIESKKTNEMQFIALGDKLHTFVISSKELLEAYPYITFAKFPKYLIAMDRKLEFYLVELESL